MDDDTEFVFWRCLLHAGGTPDGLPQTSPLSLTKAERELAAGLTDSAEDGQRKTAALGRDTVVPGLCRR